MSEKAKGKKWLNIVWKNAWQTLVALAFLVVVWLVAQKSVGNELLVPSFADCVKEGWRLMRNDGFWTAFFNTLGRVLFAFFISFVLAAIFAVIAYTVAPFRRILSPIVTLLRSVPTLAVLLIVLVWTNAATAPIVVAFLSLFPMLYAGILAALFSVDEELVVMSRVYNVPWQRRVLQLFLPSAAPYVLREASAAIAFSLKLVVSAEVLANTYKSLGGMMQEARLYLEMPTLFALVVVTFLVGILLETLGAAIATLVERRVK
ncbi:MAG: ABC transporter permease subunit [Clostridia bacterium]|nr:ABC transporter permease subunit [Clostridia bacterium]